MLWVLVGLGDFGCGLVVGLLRASVLWFVVDFLLVDWWVA